MKGLGTKCQHKITYLRVKIYLRASIFLKIKTYVMSQFDRRSVYLPSIIHPPRKPLVWDINLLSSILPCQSYQSAESVAQLIHNFSLIRKSRKAWKKLLGYGLEVCLLDSFIITRKASPQSTKEFIDYWTKVASQFIAQRSFEGKSERPPPLPLTERDQKRLCDQKHSLEVTDARRHYAF